MTGAVILDPTVERQLAASLFNDTWRLLELPDRTAEQTDEMIHCGHASRYHWGRIGERANLARGEWLCARVYSTLGRGEPALWHANRCLAILDGSRPGEDGVEDWDLPAAYEALARASAVAGDGPAAARWIARGREGAAKIVAVEDREHIEADLATIPL